MFVLPLDFSHHEQAVDQVSSAALARITRGGFILDDVSTFEPARAVHRRKPAGDVTQQTKRATDQRGAHFAQFVWSAAEAGEHLADQPAMMPFLVLDLFDFRSLPRVAERFPVSAIGVSGSQLAGVSELQDFDQLSFRI